jgi:hypothetical protein
MMRGWRAAVALALVYQLSCASGPAQRNGGKSPEVASLQAQPLRVLSQVDDDRRAAAGGPAGKGTAEEEGEEKSEKENERKSKGLAQWRALRNAAAPNRSSQAAAASQQGTDCGLSEDGEGSREGASTRLKEWRSQRQGGERLQNHVMKQAHECKECVSAAGVLKAVNFLRPDYEYEHDTVFKEMHRRAPPVTGVYICKCNRYI